MVMIYVASSGMSAGGWDIQSPSRLLTIQLISTFLGLVAFVIFTVIDGDILGENWKLLCLLIGGLLFALVILGQDDGTGNKSWIRFGPIGIQPSEFIKVMYIIVAAKQMSYLKEYKDINSLSSVVQMAGLVLVIFGVKMDDSSELGSAEVILCVYVTMLYDLGLRMYWFAAGGAAVAAAVPLLWNYFLKDYQKKRLIAPYDPLSVDPDGYGITWQTTQSKASLAAGRLTGVDSEHATTIFTGKHTDFIFSCVGETLGMVGCIAVIVLLTIIIVHCVRVGLHSGRTFDMLICMGVAGSMTFQMFINVGMCIGITPVIGITLPFFSYGGSSMMAMLAAMGLVSGVKFKLKPKLFTMAY